MIACQLNGVGFLQKGFAFFGNPKHTHIVNIFFQILVYQCLANDALPKILIFGIALAIDCQIKVPVALHVFILHPSNDVHKVTEPKSLVGLRHSFNSNFHKIHSLKPLAWVEAIIACPACLLLIFFTKIMQQLFSSAHRALCVKLHLL